MSFSYCDIFYLFRATALGEKSGYTFMCVAPDVTLDARDSCI